MQITFEMFLTIISTLFGGTGVITFFAAWKERRANVFVTMQGAYDKFSMQADQKFDAMRMEIQELKKENEDQRKVIDDLQKQIRENAQRCANCKK